MPRKPARGRGRYNTSSPTVSVTGGTGGSSSGKRSTSSAAGGGSNGKPAHLVAKQSGRTTKNSNGNRGRKFQSSRRTPGPKPTNGGRGRKNRKDNSSMQDPACYKAEDGTVYKPGDYAYVDSQQPELPYHICIINDFKMARKQSVIAEVKWFYRVTELPEAVYLLLMEDRKSENGEVFNHPKVKDRELFMAFNKDTHPASLFRGKCYIKKLDELGDKLNDFLDKEDSFFYAYGYKPESRRLTLENEESFVPGSQQAVLPDCLCPDSTGMSPDSSSGGQRCGVRDEPQFPIREEKVWDPQLSDEELLMYLRAARSIALHAGVCMTGMLADGYLAASSDETTQHAFDVLYRNGNNTENALQDLIKHPIVSRLVGKKNWTKEDTLLFSKGMKQFGKNFFKIKAELLPRKEITELVEYYYYWKKTAPGVNSRSTRRQRKTAHIRLSRALQKPREVTPDKEFVDWSSCDEDEGDSGEDGEKIKAKSFYACRHCFSALGASWHHAGPDKAILCEDCRVHFKTYGLMKPLSVKREPPEFMFKDYHESQREESATPPAASSLQSTPIKKRKTRNSNGTRAAARPGLRSAKTSYAEKTESEEDEEAEASESSESSEYDAPMPVSKPKPLQARRSILDNLDERDREDIEGPPPPKRQKREQLTEGSLSEEEGSLDSGNGESSQKSPAGSHSPGEASTSSVNDDEGDSPCSSSQASPDHAPLPQQFKRADPKEQGCARTNLVYLYEKKVTVPPKVSAFSAPGTSAHGGHPSELPTPTANVKVPIITPHAPQLPMGPPAFMGFPQAVPFQPGSMQQGPPEVAKRSNSVESTSSREREHQHLMQQQQQQQYLAAIMHQQQATPVSHLHPSHPHFTSVTVQPAQVHHHEQPQQGTPPVVFTFPTQEEMSMRQRLAGHIPSGTPDQHHIAALMQSGGYPALLAGQIEAANRMHEEHQHGLATPQPQMVIPAGGMTMEQYIMLQQQQQALAAAAMSPAGADNQPFVDFQRYCDGVMQQVQKDPSLLQHPHVQHLIQQRNMLLQQIQASQMAGHDQHHINLILQQNMLRIQQEHAMIMQQTHAQQEAAQKQKFVLGRPPVASDNTPNRSRPGVIVGTK